MKIFAILALISLFGHLEAIRYGTDTDIRKKPFAAYLISSNGRIAGSAAILNDRWVLAHVEAFNANPTSVTVGANSAESSYWSVYHLERAIRHPSYQSSAPNLHTPMLAKTANPIAFNERVQPIKLPMGVRLTPNTPVSICGYGTTELSSTSGPFRCASFVTLAENECEKRLARGGKPNLYNSYTSCVVGVSQTAQICQYDEGSAVESGGILLGIAHTPNSPGDAICRNGDGELPVVIIRVENYVTWILEEIETNK